MIVYIPCNVSDIPSGVRFDTPRVNQGQIVTTSYGGFDRSEHDHGDPYMRIADAGDRTEQYFVRKGFRLPKTAKKS